MGTYDMSEMVRGEHSIYRDAPASAVCSSSLSFLHVRGTQSSYKMCEQLGADRIVNISFEPVMPVL